MLRLSRPAWLALFLLVSLRLMAVDRSAFTFTNYDLRVSLRPEQQGIDVDGTVQVRNDSATPQSAIPLQISSSLRWMQVSVGDEQPSWISQVYTSDIDHTGALSEAILTLDKPLAPKASIKITVHYGGTIAHDSTRLTRIGTPEEVAGRSDWDQIARNFTAVRGLGYVTWYPVSIEAVSLSNGDEVFDAIAAWKQHENHATLKARIGTSVNERAEGGIVVSNASATEGVPGKVAGGIPGHPTEFGTEHDFDVSGTPTFVFGNLKAIERQHLTIYAMPEHTSLARDYTVAAEAAQAAIAEWFGEPREKAVIVELGDEDALPFEVGPYLFVPLKNIPPVALEVALARTMAHASFQSPRLWVQEGLAGFSQVLVRERQQGRKAGLAYLNQFVNALVVAESQTRSSAASNESSSKSKLPAIGPQPLLSTNDELFYRTKAAFVWEMLRDMLGDDAIKTFISRYRAADDREGSYVQHLLENAGSSHRDLEQFFDDWVYRDRGLPEFHVVTAFPRELIPQAGNTKPNYVVAVTVENTGDAWAEVPIVVRAGKDERVVRVAVAARSKAVARVPFPAVPETVIVNDGSIPEADVSDNSFTLPAPASK